MLVVLELLDQPLDFVLACCILLLDCRKRYSRYSVVHGVVTSFTVILRIAWSKMIFRLGFVDLVDRIAESSEPFGRAPPVFSYIPLSQCKSQAVCCRERPRVTVFGQTASLSLERASIRTKIQYF